MNRYARDCEQIGGDLHEFQGKESLGTSNWMNIVRMTSFMGVLHQGRAAVGGTVGSVKWS